MICPKYLFNFVQKQDFTLSLSCLLHHKMIKVYCSAIFSVIHTLSSLPLLRYLFLLFLLHLYFHSTITHTFRANKLRKEGWLVNRKKKKKKKNTFSNCLLNTKTQNIGLTMPNVSTLACNTSSTIENTNILTRRCYSYAFIVYL